jgi:hypothetical protein
MEVLLIFHASSAKPIDEKLRDLVNEIETKNPDVSVLAARQFRYSLHQTSVEISIKEPREFNVLEEFIIRAGIEFEPPPTEDELASILGLDPIFVRSTTANLKTLNTLSATSPITVTAEGRSFYEKGSVPQPPYSVQIYAISDSLGGKLTFQSEPFNDVQINLPDLADFIKNSPKIPDISSLSLAEIQQNIQSSDLDFHQPETGKIVTACKVLTATKIIWKKISLIVVFDAKKDKLNIQIKGGKQLLNSAATWLESLQAKGKISLPELCKLSDDHINLERASTFKYKNAEIAARLEKNTQTALRLRDEQINQTFWKILNSAKHQILIYSPWLSQAIVNEEFVNTLQELVNRGVWILIGYGISPEEKPISPEIAEKLRSIKSVDNLPGVQILYLGDSHIKEVIVDEKTYLYGFHDWLSYNGDYLPTGELVYQVTISQQVQEAHQFLVHRLQNHAQKIWNNAVENHNFQLAVESLCVWGALGMQNIALQKIQQSNWLELLPVWLNVILQRLRSHNLPTDSADLKTALSLLNQISGEETFIELLQQGWRKIIDAIAINQPETALNLLSDEVWAQFLRLNIVHNHDSPTKLIYPHTAPKKRK